MIARWRWALGVAVPLVAAAAIVGIGVASDHPQQPSPGLDRALLSPRAQLPGDVPTAGQLAGRWQLTASHGQRYTFIRGITPRVHVVFSHPTTLGDGEIALEMAGSDGCNAFQSTPIKEQPHLPGARFSPTGALTADLMTTLVGCGGGPQATLTGDLTDSFVRLVGGRLEMFTSDGLHLETFVRY